MYIEFFKSVKVPFIVLLRFCCDKECLCIGVITLLAIELQSVCLIVLRSYAMADRIDQMAFLTLAGVSYAQKNNGADRSAGGGSTTLESLTFASDVTAPTTNRHRRWDATNGLSAGDTSAVAADDKISYRCIVELKAFSVRSICAASSWFAVCL